MGMKIKVKLKKAPFKKNEIGNNSTQIFFNIFD